MSLTDVLVERDGISPDEARRQIEAARDELYERIEGGEMPFDFMQDEFGLEPDYLMELL